MRGGKLTGRELYRSCSAAGERDTLETFIASYYTEERPPPAKIYLGTSGLRSGDGEEGADPLFGETANIGRYFRERFGYAPEFCAVNADGEDGKRHTAALAMARQNALEDLRKRLKERGAEPALDELKAALSLRRRPVRIEGFDIAQLDGKHPVSSLISFKNGVPDRKNYRHFKLRTVIGIVDDFAAMREAVRRRYSRLLREGSDLPDLILIDGGVGQVNAAQGVLAELGLDCDVVGLAKRDEELWLPAAASPVKLPRRSEALKVLQAVRDEAHRFATGLNQRLRSTELSFPALESVDGVGRKRAAALMRRYGSLSALAGADCEEIAASCKIPVTLAKTVKAAARLAVEDAGIRQESAGRCFFF
jgi:excinuclease ABC subunit C